MINLWAFINRFFLFWSNPDHKTIDRSGIVNSDYPTIGNGWIKGWAIAKDKIIVAKHAGPSTNAPHNQVFFMDKLGNKIERTIVAVDNKPFKVDGINEAISFRGEENYFTRSDIAICKLNEPLPDSIAVYELSDNPYVKGRWAVTFNQFGEFTEARVHYSSDLAWIFGKKRSKTIIGGDSGLPWFVWEKNKWKVLTHMSRGVWGEGPYYAHPLIYKEFLERVKAL